LGLKIVCLALWKILTREGISQPGQAGGGRVSGYRKTMQVSIIGAGGHAKVVYDALVLSGMHVLGFLDDDRALWGRRWFGVPITGPVRTIAELSTDGAIVAIGDNAARKRVYLWLKEQSVPVINAIHPTAVLAATARTGEGVAIFANVVVNVDTVIGDNVILNTACTVDHSCNVGDHVHLGPGVHLCGEVVVGESTLLGVGQWPYQAYG
jgi:sugar O-acyltransferase (sialic acid O-acetyltransferase NeuD family)